MMQLSKNEKKSTQKEEKSIKVFNEKEEFFLNNSSLEHRNKPNRDENNNTKQDDA